MKHAAKIFFLIFSCNVVLANAATVDIANGDTTNLSTLGFGDTANFLGSIGTLSVDTTKSLASITATTAQKGTIDISSVNTLTVTGNIGTTVNSIQNIIFNAGGTLVANGDINTQAGITTATNNVGNLTLSGSAAQAIAATIGSSSLRLNTISVTQGTGAITFSGNVFANNLATSSSSGTVVISGAGGLNFNSSAFNQDTTINSTGTNNFGATTLADAKTLTLNSDASLSSLVFGTSGNLVLASGKTATITGDVSGTGLIKGSANNLGGILFSGTLAQSVGANVQLGDGSNRLNKITSSNTSGITLNNNAFTTTLDFTNAASTTAQITIASGKKLDVAGNITQSGAGSSLINGVGKVSLSGVVAQTIATNLGLSTSSRLGELEVNNSGGVTLSNNSFLTVLRSTGTSAITNNAALDASSFAVDQDASISGSGTNSFGATTLANAKTLTLNSDASLSSLAFGTSGNLVLASGKTATITSDVSGTGLIKGSATAVGNVLFSGSVAQNIASTVQLGDSSDLLSQISVSNVSGINFGNDVFINTLDFSNTSGTASTTIASGKTINVTGNITQSGAGSSFINGAGKVSLSGSSAQTVNSNLGSSTSDRLGELIINNSSGVTLNQDAFLTTLTQTSGALAIASAKTVDVTSSVSLTGKTLTIGIGTSPSVFGTIKSGGAITVDNTTNINFDYSNNSLFVTHDGTTQFLIANSTSPISGLVSDIVVNDNSFLFNNSLVADTNNIYSVVRNDTSRFNIDVLGADNFALLNNALNNTNMTSGIVSISSQSQLDNGLKSLKPNINGVLNTAIAIDDSIANLTKLHMQQMNYDVAGFSNKINKSSDGRFWAQTFGGIATQNSTADNFKYTANSAGLILGGDKLFKGEGNMILGVAFAYSNASISSDLENSGDANNKINKNSISSYHLTLYNNNSSRTGLGFYNDNIVNLSYNQYQSARNIVVGSLSEGAKADFNGYSYSAHSDVGYNFKIADKTLFAPNIGLKYLSLNHSGYQESGAAIDGLRVEKQNLNNVVAEIGLNLTNRFEDEYFSYVPKIYTSVERTLTDSNPQSKYTFIGGGTQMKADNNIQKNKLNLGLSLNIFDDGNASSLQLQYNAQFASGFMSNNGSVQYRYAF